MATKKVQSPRGSLNGWDWEKIGKAAAYVTASTIIAGLIAVFASPDIEFPAWLLPLVPAINVFLVGAKSYLDGPKAK